MTREIINPPHLAPPYGFNHGILVSGGSLLFLAGQDASDGSGAIVAPGDLLGQFEQVMRNLTAVVEAAGGAAQDIVKLNIFVRSRDKYVSSLGELGVIFKRYFAGHYPTFALFEVAGFFQPEALIEMEGMAVIPEKAGGS